MHMLSRINRCLRMLLLWAFDIFMDSIVVGVVTVIIATVVVVAIAAVHSAT